MKEFPKKFINVIFSWFTRLYHNQKPRDEVLQKEQEIALEDAQRIAKDYYFLDEGEDFHEITDKVLESNKTSQTFKKLILESGRRFIVFNYPSDKLQVKGLLSFVPNSFHNPLLIFLRGGNRLLSLPDPATDYICFKNYTVLTTTYRGGVSEGKDEYGGNDVNDVENLMTFFPHLQAKVRVYFEPSKIFMLGASRGGMEAFLSLGRFPSLQKIIHKVCSLSGLVDMNECIRDRNDMKQMFINDFGLLPNENEEEWVRHRNPIEAVSKIRKDLPFLIIQGTSDLRVPLKEGYNMVKKLKENGNPVTYREISGGTHCLRNHKDRMELIADWFEII
ncbi:MAG: prolyl oligopeptidase family serine peptidase [Parachlamydiaceae bacterium]|nr:prolyl oligopeptidase family serine peptidase [Parachlamydiaceae bacterium]